MACLDAQNRNAAAGCDDRASPSQRLLEDTGESLHLFSLLLAPPGPPHVRLLRADARLPGGGDWVAAQGDDATLLAWLREEHTRLFVNAFPGLVAPPYAAFYLAAEDAPAFLQRIAYRLQSLGLGGKGATNERPDHVRVLLEAASHCPEGVQRAEFLAEFLLPWLDTYLGRLAAAASLPLYPALVRAAQALICIEARETDHDHGTLAS
jgi:TorA maturation chaperone TorD